MLANHLIRSGAVTIRLCAGAGVVLLLATPARCEADGQKTARDCLASYRHAQAREREVHLREAERSWRACAAIACSSSLRQTCAGKVTQLEQDIPSIVPLVTDLANAPRLDVQVRMDGVLLASQLDGRALPVDPGLHAFSFDVGGTVVEKTVMIAQGQRNHPIWISLADNAAPKKQAPAAPIRAEPVAAPSRLAAAAPSASGSLVLPYSLGAAGLLAGGAYALLASWGRQDNARLAHCSPDCSPASVQHIRDLYLAADISLGVAVAALAASAWLFIAAGTAAEQPPSAPAYSVSLQPVRSGAFASIARSF